MKLMNMFLIDILIHVKRFKTFLNSKIIVKNRR